MVEQEKYVQHYYAKKEILEELGENPSIYEVLDHLLGDTDGCRTSDYVCYKYKTSKKTLINRLNLMWVYPLIKIE